MNIVHFAGDEDSIRCLYDGENGAIGHLVARVKFGPVYAPDADELARQFAIAPEMLDVLRHDYGGVAPDLPNLLEWAISAIEHRTPSGKANVIPDKLRLAVSKMRAVLAKLEAAE